MLWLCYAAFLLVVYSICIYAYRGPIYKSGLNYGSDRKTPLHEIYAFKDLPLPEASSVCVATRLRHPCMPRFSFGTGIQLLP
jgi:hypothetical protein